MLRKPPMKTHPDGTPWEYPLDSWRDGPHFSASYLHRMVPADDHEAELIDAPLADPKLNVFPNVCRAHHAGRGRTKATAYLRCRQSGVCLYRISYPGKLRVDARRAEHDRRFRRIA